MFSDSLAREIETSHHVLFTAFWCWGAVVTDSNSSLGSRTALCLVLYKHSWEVGQSCEPGKQKCTNNTEGTRAASRGFRTSKLPRNRHTLYEYNSKAWEGIWWRPLLSYSSEGQLCSVGEEFLGSLVLHGWWGAFGGMGAYRPGFGHKGTGKGGQAAAQLAYVGQEESPLQPLPQLLCQAQ